MNGITIKDGENIEKALRFFTKMIDNTGVIAEVKDRRRYSKPCEIRREKRKAAIRKVQMKDKWDEMDAQQHRKVRY